MDNYRGIYFNNQKEQKYFEGGAHFKYKDLYNKLLELYNKRNNIYFPHKYLDLYLSPRNNNKNIEKNEDNNSIKIVKNEKSCTNSKKKTRNKKNNSKLSDSDSKDDDHYKEINLNILDKSKDNNNFYNDLNNLKYETSRLSYYNKMFLKIHHNSINKNYQFSNRKNKNNISVKNEIKGKEYQKSKNITNIQINKSINDKNKKNKSNKNPIKTIYNYCYLKYENNNTKKMPKLKTNNDKNKYIFDIGKYSYNLYDNIYLKNKIQNNLKQLKYNSLVKENNIKKNSISSISKNKDKSNKKSIRSISKNKDISNNISIRSIDKNYINQKKNNTKRLQCHIDSVDYSSIYQGLNSIKTPTYKIKNGIFKNNITKITNEPIYNIKMIINKKNYENLLNQVNKNKTSYAKIKKNQLSFTKSKKLNNKEIVNKEIFKRDT